MEDPVIIQKLEHREIKPTSMWILGLKTLLKQTYAISVNDLENILDRADRITLFRTLKTFEQHGLVHRIDDGTGVMKYALTREAYHSAPERFHIHFFCTQCEKTYCILNSAIPDFKLPVNFRMDDVSVVMKGICDNCNHQSRQKINASDKSAP